MVVKEWFSDLREVVLGFSMEIISTFCSEEAFAAVCENDDDQEETEETEGEEKVQAPQVHTRAPTYAPAAAADRRPRQAEQSSSRRTWELWHLVTLFFDV